MPEDEWGSPGGQEMFQELFTLCLMERNRTASQRRFQTDEPHLDVSGLN